MPPMIRVPGGLFVTLEGPEGAGKTTQCRLLASALEREGYSVCVTREPGGSALGERIRDLLMRAPGDEDICDEAEVLLFAASRAQHVRRVIRPALNAGEVVICDRFADSTTVYQGMARGLPLDFIEALHGFTLGATRPDLTIVLDLDVEAGFGRKAAGDVPDRIEREPRAFHERVRQGFLELARREPARVRVVAADEPVDTVHERIWEIVRDALERKHG